MAEDEKQPVTPPVIVVNPKERMAEINAEMRRGCAFCFGEFLVIVVPLVVVTAVYLFTGRTWEQILQSPEWAFGAAVLFGQTILKLVSAIAKEGLRGLAVNQLMLILLIIGGLLPSLIILALLLSTEKVSEILVNCQEGWFIVAACLFLLFGSATYTRETVESKK